jgi:hypothetical protein
MTRRQPPRAHGDQGAVLVEFALLAPVLVLFVVGVLDFGFAFWQANIIERSAANAARIGSSAGQNLTADESMVLSVGSTLNSTKRIELQRMVVYRSTTAGGGVPEDCMIEPEDIDPGGDGEPGLCNVYSADMVADGTGFTVDDGGTPDPEDDEDDTCASDSWDRFWCPTTREVSRQVTPDYVGVWVEVEYTGLTGLIPGTLTLDRYSVYLMEPSSVAS